MLEAVSLDQLRMLIAIADSGSFSAAARRLGRAQSAVSHGIGQLEDALGFKLFDRQERRPRLTEAGRTVLVDARSLVTGAAELRARARSIAEGMEPELSLAVDVMFPLAPLIEAIKALRENFPLLPVALHTEALGAVEARVADGSARIGIGLNWPSDPGQGIERRYLATVTMASVVAAGHPLAAWSGIVPRRELERHVQLVLTDRSQLSAGVLRGVVSPHAWRFGDMQTRYQFLLAGLGFCNMPLHMVEADLAEGRLQRIEVEGWGAPNYGLPLHLVFRRGYEPGKAAAWLIGRLEKALADCVGPAAQLAAAAPKT